MSLSPLWFAYYLSIQHDINLFSKGFFPYFSIYVGVSIFIGLLVLRFAPGGDRPMPLIAATPIALYGFIMAASMIDYIADNLVALLDFIGIVLHIPGSIMGLTILAWGNSMADLSANITMARKGKIARLGRERERELCKTIHFRFLKLFAFKLLFFPKVWLIWQ